MTVSDTTYFKTETKQCDNMADPYKYQNTCHFLRLNSNNRRLNYSLTEIQNVLEHDKLPNTTPSQNREAEAPVEVSCSKSKDKLVGTYQLHI